MVGSPLVSGYLFSQSNEFSPTDQINNNNGGQNDDSR